MDAMLNQLGYNDTGIGLHITSSGGGSGGQEKPMGKAKNKYEKRRQKAARAKGGKEKSISPVKEEEKKEKFESISVVKRYDPGAEEVEEDDIVMEMEEKEEKVESKVVLGQSKISKKKKINKPSKEKAHASVVEKGEKDENNLSYYETYHMTASELDETYKGGVARESKPSDHIFEKGDFASLGLHGNIVKALSTKLNCKNPTSVQRAACVNLLTGELGKTKNLFIQSETGSGKTLAYLLPILNLLAVEKGKLKKIDRKIGGTRCLVIAPTRELASQTFKVANELCLNTFSWIVPGCLSGGENRKSEKARLRKGCGIMIGTPGRILDHLVKTEVFGEGLKGRLEWVVLDEADRLLDMGLGKQVEEIVQRLRRNEGGRGGRWGNVLVSATINESIQKLAEQVLGGKNSPKWEWARAENNGIDDVAKLSRGENKGGEIDIESALEKFVDEDFKGGDIVADKKGFDASTPRQLSQSYVICHAKLRLPALCAFLASHVREKIVVFMSTCDGVDFHLGLFNATRSIVGGKGSTMLGNTPILRMHGNVPHSERAVTMSKFEKSDSCVLLATDVAARGLNLPGANWIVQYDPPSETADYIHRAGRAARAGAAGNALLFLLPSESKYLDILKVKGLKGMGMMKLEGVLEEGAGVCKEVTREGVKKSGGGSRSDGEAFATAIQIRLEGVIVSDDEEKKREASRVKKEARAAAEVAEKEKGEGGGGKGSKKAWKGGEVEAQKVLNTGLLAKGRKAYQAFIRAYSAKEKAVRHIFSSRSLHVGHIARSFALKESPKELKEASSKQMAVEYGGGKRKKEGC
ncbi:hypothetical protein TL16_g03143 [Triparma laevis f. inornata]|uniref:ATP-dependent RNA helicase n=1 Tax=Triparma laevis f. inornata TaxID=1714386 RepID=A0A9W7A0W6_9STRA|nr:hypothetical protein TL16_g03143 [Triparma laevis f. inornata]